METDIRSMEKVISHNQIPSSFWENFLCLRCIAGGERYCTVSYQFRLFIVWIRHLPGVRLHVSLLTKCLFIKYVNRTRLS